MKVIQWFLNLLSINNILEKGTDDFFNCIANDSPAQPIPAII